MSFDAHITRADDWADSESQPIPQSEWTAVVEADASLRLSDTIYYDRDADDGESTRLYAVEWLEHPQNPEEPPCFWYADGQIAKRSPDDATLQKMIELAKLLRAKVVGDRNEVYEERLLIEEVVVPDQPVRSGWWKRLRK